MDSPEQVEVHGHECPLRFYGGWGMAQPEHVSCHCRFRQNHFTTLPMLVRDVGRAEASKYRRRWLNSLTA